MNVLRVLVLVYSNKIRERLVVTKVVGWSVGLFGVICVCIAGLFFLPLLWVVLAGVFVVTAFGMISLHRIADGVLATVLTDRQFYELVGMEHVLSVARDAGDNFARPNKVVPVQDPRPARRRDGSLP